MQTRTCFNGGELSAEMAARCDIDAYMRGCRVLENWDVAQMGGVKRRRGMRGVCESLGRGSKVVGYEYSREGGCFLVELCGGQVRVLTRMGEEVVRFVSGVRGVPKFFYVAEEVRVLQLNALLVVTCRDVAPMVLRWEDDGSWSFKEMVFKHRPWRYAYERRAGAVELSAAVGADGERVWGVRFEEGVEAAEVQAGDVLRVSVWLDEAEAAEAGADVRGRVRVVEGVVPCAVGDVVAVKEEVQLCYWVCKKEFVASVFVDGLDDPGCYPDNFEKSESVSGFDGVTVVASVGELGTVKKGTKFAVRCGYWVYYTCVREFGAGDISAALGGYGDYGAFFVRGVALGEALPCRGKWSFYCSGLWYGCYEVRRSFVGPELTDEWETAGVSFSRVNEASNTTLGGDEGDEECWLRLFLTRSKQLTDVLEDGYPSDSCGNRLVVEGYRHDFVLRLDEGGRWVCEDGVQVPWVGRARVYDWSWPAFCRRYGYPVLCEVFNCRLVFAGTAGQPQTLWMSRTDDLYNFAPGDTDDSAIVVTLYTRSQNAICWLLEANGRLLLGTADAEWTVQARNASVVTPTNVWASRHSRVGSARGLMLAVDDKALFVQRGGGRLWSYGYSFEVDGCRSTDLTVFAPHVLGEHGGVVDCAVVEVPDTVGVFVCGDGQVGLCTYNSLHQVQAWHRWVTDGRVLSVATLPGVHGGGDGLYFVVERGDGVWVEAVDELSGYVDRGGREYESVLVTTALGNVLEEVVGKRPKQPCMVLLGADLEAGRLDVCADGGSWARPATNEAVLRAGWRQLLVFNRWGCEHAVGLRVRGEGGASILALQG